MNQTLEPESSHQIWDQQDRDTSEAWAAELRWAYPFANITAKMVADVKIRSRRHLESWIYVKDRSPFDGFPVYVLYGNGWEGFNRFVDNRWEIVEEYKGIISLVYRWMPIKSEGEA